MLLERVYFFISFNRPSEKTPQGNSINFFKVDRTHNCFEYKHAWLKTDQIRLMQNLKKVF